jgi:hypothetical protein
VLNVPRSGGALCEHVRVDEPLSRSVNLDLGNMAEVNMVAINAAHIVFVRLTGALSSMNRKMEVRLADGGTIAMTFDEPDHAETVFTEVVATLNRTIPDHLSPPISAPQP